jgi:hypothetical protein
MFQYKLCYVVGIKMTFRLCYHHPSANSKGRESLNDRRIKIDSIGKDYCIARICKKEEIKKTISWFLISPLRDE